MVDTKSLKLNDTVYLIRSGSWSYEMMIGTVEHITPTGRVRVRVGEAPGRTIDFNNRGEERGAMYRSWSISTKERYDQHIKQQQMKVDERAIMTEIKGLPALNYDDVLKSLDTIRDLILKYKETYREGKSIR